MEQTFYWHDYETFGLKSRTDRPVQFAGIRTTLDFQPVKAKPDVWYEECAPDYLPDPQACMVTGITPQEAHARGAMKEYDFAGAIYNEFTQEGTISIGYNNLGFDDEVTRHLFWRNFYDVYGREFAKGCSRWDLFPVVQATWALRPEGINWPKVTDEKGRERVSFRLEHLSAANRLAHSHAHDAASDVEATIAMAKLISKVQPKFWNWVFQNRTKEAVLSALDGKKPVVWIDRMAGQERGYIRCVFPICRSPRSKNECIVWDCSYDPDCLQTMSPEEIARRAWGPNTGLLEGEERLPLRRIKANACPIVCADLRVLTSAVRSRFCIDLERIVANAEKLSCFSDALEGKMLESFENSTNPVKVDADAALYSGGFPVYGDKEMMTRIHACEPMELAEAVHEGRIHFEDERLTELLWRLRARNWPETLNDEETMRWKLFCAARLEGRCADVQSLTQYFETIDTLAQCNEENLDGGLISEAEYDRRQELFDTLYAWGEYVGEMANN